MSVFVVFCVAMALVAIAAVIYPLLRPMPVTRKGEPVLAKANGVALTIALALPIIAGAMYAGISTFPWVNPQAAAPVPPGHGSGEAGTMAEAMATLEARLQQNPDDAQGWRMLGRTYLVSGDAVKAVGAYEKAARLLPARDPGLELDLAEAMVLTDDSAMQPRAQQIVDAALAEDGNNQKALWYAGVLAVRAGDNTSAKTHWLKLLDQSPPDEIRQVIVAQLQEIGVEAPAGAATVAREPMMASNAGPAMGSASMTGGPGDPATAAQGRAIRIAVSVDPSVAAKLKPGTPLFVSARQPGIPGPPLAAVRLSSDELPASVVLSDANAMIEGRNLSSVDDVEVVARVAFGGTAVIASGDLLGTAVQKKGGPAELSVVISRIQP
jgi:cytochrome c-type biogenesis protein CcmH